MKKDALAKHHFWILFGVTPVLIGLAFLLMWVFVSGEVQAKKAEYKTKMDALASTPKTKGEVAAMDKRKEVLTEQKEVLWSTNYQRQDDAHVFDWPTGKNQVLKLHSDKKYKFGAPFRVVGNELSPMELEKAFNAGYDKLADQIAPTRFTNGNWRTAVRYVSNWGMKPLDPPEVWLALEDYWVQKALLMPIADLNKRAAEFTDVTAKEADQPLKRTFQNRVWELELEVTDQGRQKLMKGVLRNRTDRLQTIGMNKSMRVNVWLNDANSTQPDFAFLIQGENVPGKGQLVCEPREIQNVPQVTKLAKAVQVFDAATVPVRLVNTIELGMLDHKNRAAVLEAPQHLESEEGGGDVVSTDPFDGGAGVGSPDGGMMPGGPGGMMPGGPRGMGATTGSGKSGSPEAVLLGNKQRYLRRTEDVRRMPAALSVVIDRDYVNDLLIEYSNSVLRFQVTQTQWQRYRSTLPPIGGTGNFAMGAPAGGGGYGGYGGGMGRMPGGPAGVNAGGPGGAGGTGSADGGDEERGRGQFGGGRMPGGPLGGMPGGVPGTGTLSASDEDILPPEASAGLVELAVFGVLSLYEKKEAPAAAPADPNAPPMTDPMPAGGNPPADGNNGAAPTEPMPGDKPRGPGDDTPPEAGGAPTQPPK